METVKVLDLTQDQLEKIGFVHKYLEPMVGCMTNYRVDRIRYRAYTCGHETVTLYVDSNSRFDYEPHEVVLDVTDCKSLLAIAERVLEAIGGKTRSTGGR